MQINDHFIEIVGTAFFAIAVLHTFLASQILKLSHRFPKESFREGVIHLLGEIEVVFGFWAAIFFLVWGLTRDFASVSNYIESINFTEPIFVFCIMIVAASRPVMNFVHSSIEKLSHTIAKYLKLAPVFADLFFVLVLGSLSGSFITEPAAMTISALLLLKMVEGAKGALLYMVLATLLVNISIGGALTHFAAPPVLMVAGKWNWDFEFMMTHFGWKAALAVVVNTLLLLLIFRKQIKKECRGLTSGQLGPVLIPRWITVVHYLFLAGIVISAHNSNTCLGFLLMFLGLYSATKKYQRPLRFRESLLVAYFLAGIIIFGTFQRWWLEPLVTSFDELELFFGSVFLTAVTDNAALTYLGSLVPDISDSSKYYLVAGALAGGGLTLIANAPNMAGYAILQEKFPEGLSPAKLIKAALLPTAVAIIFLGYL